jgi:hypothetical protein
VNELLVVYNHFKIIRGIQKWVFEGNVQVRIRVDTVFHASFDSRKA